MTPPSERPRERSPLQGRVSRPVRTWISNAPEADFHTVFAKTTPGVGAKGITAFGVSGDRPGLSGAHLDMLSPRPIGSLVFDGVPAGDGDLLGEPDHGFRVAMRPLDLFRPSVGEFAFGMATAPLDAAVPACRDPRGMRR